MSYIKSAMPEAFGEKQSFFNYIDRGAQTSIVLIPGWATDQRIFSSLALNFNYILPCGFYPAAFAQNLISELVRNKIKKINLFGWSMGGFLAAQFAAKFSNLVDKLILVGVRKKYKRKELLEIKGLLKKNKKAYLYKFYTQCFFQKSQMQWFRQNLLKDYCDKMDLNYLLDTLNYLETLEIKPEFLKSIKQIKIIHGQDDKIAPIDEARAIKNELAQAEFISIKNAGHMVFLSEDLSKYIW